MTPLSTAAAADTETKIGAQLGPRERVQKGREELVRAALARIISAALIAMVLVGTAMWAAHHGGHRLYIRREVVIVGAFILLVLALIAIFRVLAERVLDPEKGSECERQSNAATVGQPAPRSSGGTVVCCSGGGIKSASFCLGALKGLSERSDYAPATHLVGVSGGGYAAAAYWAASRQSTDPFGSSSEELLALRNRTRYLASSRRVRWDGLVSLLSGLMFNLLLLASLATIGLWILAHYTVSLGLGRLQPYGVSGADKSWVYGDSFGWKLACWPAVVPLLVALGMFLVDRFQSKNPAYAPKFGSRAPQGWWSNTPNILTNVTATWLLAVPGLTWLAISVHNFLLDRADLWAQFDAKVTALTGAGVLTTFGLLVRSAWKGLGAPTSKGATPSFWTNVLIVFRGWVAPRAAGALLAVAAVLGCAVAYSYMLADNFLYSNAASRLVVMALVVVVLALVVVSANGTSMHVFYRDRLAHAYLNHGASQGTAAWSLDFSNQAPPPDSDVQAKLQKRWQELQEQLTPPPGKQKLNTAEAKGVQIEQIQVEQDLAALQGPPSLVLCATANLREPDSLPAGRNGTSFIISHDRVGFTDELRIPGGQMSWSDYRDQTQRIITVAQAIAISGAAIAPIQGRESSMEGLRPLFAIANVRLGVWLPNPFWAMEPVLPTRPRRFFGKVERALNRATSFRVFKEAFSEQFSVNAPRVLVTDGGHYDNLGILEALALKPEHLIVLDGSGDAEDQFPTIGRAIATARMDSSIEITFDPKHMMSRKKKGPKSACVSANATWKDGTECRISYIKCVKPAVDSTWDLDAYQLKHPDFPATSSSLEMYDEFDFEAFHQLGYRIANTAELNIEPESPAR